MSELETAPRRVQLSNTVIIAGLFAIAAAMALHEFVGGEGLREGTPAPSATFRRLDGSTVTLESLRGKVVLLNFWATWCGPCNEEMPELVGLARAYESRGVVFVAANQEEPDESIETVEPWLRSHDEARPFVVYGGPALTDAFLVEALPTTYVIDASGTVRASARGQVAAWQVKKWLDDALD